MDEADLARPQLLKILELADPGIEMKSVELHAEMRMRCPADELDGGQEAAEKLCSLDEFDADDDVALAAKHADGVEGWQRFVVVGRPDILEDGGVKHESARAELAA